MKLKWEIIHQGHWWIEGVWNRGFHPGALQLFIFTEQKRPAHSYTIYTDDSYLEVGIGPREYSMHFREGEDGTEPTTVRIHMPRTMPWRKWDYAIFDEDKYSLMGAVFTRAKWRSEYPLYWWYKRRFKRLTRLQAWVDRTTERLWHQFVLCKLGRHQFKMSMYGKRGQRGACVWCQQNA